jgi:hypothetical protein
MMASPPAAPAVAIPLGWMVTSRIISSSSSTIAAVAMPRRPSRGRRSAGRANGQRKRLAVVLGHVSDPSAHLVRYGLSAPADLAGVGFEHAEDDAHGGGLAGAVGTDEPEQLALGDGERQVVEGHQVAIAARQSLQFQHVAVPTRSGRMQRFRVHDSSGAGFCRPAAGGTWRRSRVGRQAGSGESRRVWRGALSSRGSSGRGSSQ